MCSDGLVGVVSDEEIAAVLGSIDEPAEAARILIEMANGAGGPDNITVIVAHVDGDALKEATGEDALTFAHWRIDPDAPTAAASVNDTFDGFGPPTAQLSAVASERAMASASASSHAARKPTMELMSMAVVIGLILGSIVTGLALYRHGVRCHVAARQPGLAVLSDGHDTGARTGDSAVELRLPAGRHTMSLRAQGTPPFAEREVQVEPGQMCEVSFTEPRRAVKVTIDIVGGARAGQRLTLDAGGKPIRIGRHPENDVAFDAERDCDASGRHAELRVDGGQLWLYDLGSANGTRLAGLPVAGKAAVPPGAEIEFGAGGPRVRVGYEGAGPMIPATIANPNGKPMVPGTVGAGGKVGQRTVALMIENALARARREPERLRVLVVALAALLVVTIGGVVVAYRVRPPGDVTLRREMVKIMEQQRAASDAERAGLQKKLDELGGKLQRAGEDRRRRDRQVRTARPSGWSRCTRRRGRRRASARRSRSPTIGWSPTRTASPRPRICASAAARSSSCRTATRARGAPSSACGA